MSNALQDLFDITKPPVKAEVPPNTCPKIDTVLNTLEEIRFANEQLRDASYSHYQQAKRFYKFAKTTALKNVELEEANKELQLTREFLESVAAGATSPKAREVVNALTAHEENKAHLRKLLDIEEIALNIVEAVCSSPKTPMSSPYIYMRRRVSDKTRCWLDETHRKREAHMEEARNAAIAKLTPDEIAVLGIPSQLNEDESEI